MIFKRVFKCAHICPSSPNVCLKLIEFEGFVRIMLAYTSVL
jgi:hypothetical protein